MVDAFSYQKSVIWVGCGALAAYSSNEEPHNILGPTPILNPNMCPYPYPISLHPMCIAFKCLQAVLFVHRTWLTMVDANSYPKSVIWVGCRALAAYSCDEEPQIISGPTPLLNPTMRPYPSPIALHPMCITFNYWQARFICASDLAYIG